jgi:hypothetical protein
MSIYELWSYGYLYLHDKECLQEFQGLGKYLQGQYLNRESPLGKSLMDPWRKSFPEDPKTVGTSICTASLGKLQNVNSVHKSHIMG